MTHLLISSPPVERSQMLNRAEALKRLKEKLSVIAQDQALADFNEIKGDLVEASFGMQIRWVLYFTILFYSILYYTIIY